MEIVPDTLIGAQEPGEAASAAIAEATDPAPGVTEVLPAAGQGQQATTAAVATAARDSSVPAASCLAQCNQEQDGSDPKPQQTGSASPTNQQQQQQHRTPTDVQALNPRLDFTSPDFDPQLALATEGLRPPFPNAPELDNVAKFRALLPSELAEELRSGEGAIQQRDPEVGFRPF